MASWHKVYQGGNMIGWAWTGTPSATFVSFSCMPTRGLQVTKKAPNFWDELTRPAPKYVGAPSYFHFWNKISGAFLGWYWVGYGTAQVVARYCPNVDVVTPQGTPVT